MAIGCYLGRRCGRERRFGGEDRRSFVDEGLVRGSRCFKSVAVKDGDRGLGGKPGELLLEHAASGEGVTAVDFPHGAGEGMVQPGGEDAKADGDCSPDGDDCEAVGMRPAAKSGKRGGWHWLLLSDVAIKLGSAGAGMDVGRVRTWKMSQPHRDSASEADRRPGRRVGRSRDR